MAALGRAASIALLHTNPRYGEHFRRMGPLAFKPSREMVQGEEKEKTK
jgi:hypothetical protein